MANDKAAQNAPEQKPFGEKLTYSIKDAGYVAQTSLFGPDEAPQPKIERRGSANIHAQMSARPGEISQVIRNNMILYKQPQCKTDEEVADRIEAYFTWCAGQDILPTWEALALALGVTRAALWNWETGKDCSPTRTAMVQTAKQILSAVDAELAMNGRVQPVTYIFRSKNFYGMRDQQDIIVTPSNPLGSTVSAEELAKRIGEGVIIDGDEVGATVTDSDD